VDENPKSGAWGAIKTVFGVVAFLATIWVLVETTLESTAKARAGSWWLWPITAILWVGFMIPLGIAILAACLAAAVLFGYFMDVITLMGVDLLLSGNVAGGIVATAFGLIVLAAIGGFMYEGIRQAFPDEPPIVPAIVTIILWFLLIVAGTLPYINSVIHDKPPIYQL
jgi:hypothetical protein